MIRRLKGVARMIIVVGGSALSVEKECRNSIEISDDANSFRMTSKTLNESRRSPALVRTPENDVLILGGCNGPTHLNSVEKFCTRTEEVTTSNLELPQGLSCAAYCQLENGSAYVFGGYNGQECLNSVIRVDEQSASYQTSLLGRLKNSSAIAISSTEILLFGGWDEHRTLQTVFAYSTSDGSQCFHAHLPYPVEAHSSVRHDNNVFIVGGYDGISVVPTIIRFDLETKKSEVLQVRLKVARENHAAVKFERDGQQFLLVIGGWDGYNALTSCELFQLLPDDPWLKRVECQFQLNEPRNRPAAIVV